MMRRKCMYALSCSILLISMVGTPDIAMAFEMETHALITQHAISDSVLGLTHLDNDRLRPDTEKIIRDLGLWKGLIPQPEAVEGDCESLPDKHRTLGKLYFDGPRRSKLYCRSVTGFDDVIRLSTPWPGSIENWITMGAIREDDNSVQVPPWANDDPNQIEIHGYCPSSIVDIVPIFFPITSPQVELLDCRRQRVLNHFLDPYNNRTLNKGDLLLGWPNPEWVIPRRWISPEWRIAGGRPSPPDQPDIWTAANQYTLWDMQEALFRGLTGHTFINGELKSVAPTQRQRNRWFATSFRALGDVLHLNQDMGQPQHTRNDHHAGKFPGGPASAFEAYVNARALNDKRGFEVVAADLLCHMPKLTPLLYESPYEDPPRFPNYLDYWTTSPGRENEGKVGKGLADYTNRGFFTQGTNLGDNDYPSPKNDISAYEVKTMLIVSGAGCDHAIESKILKGEVLDALSGKRDVVPLTQKRSQFSGYTLSRPVYDAMADLVVPRAVAYSTGLINHIFRGRLDIALPPEGVYALTDHSHGKGFERIKAVIKNTTKDIPTSDGESDAQHLSGGVLIGIVRFHRNTCYSKDLRGEYSLLENFADCSKGTQERNDLQQEIVVSKPKTGFSLQTNTPETVELDFSETPIPFAATDVYLQLVYHGRLGSEPAVVIGGKDLSEPTYVGLINSLDYTFVKGVPYSRNDLLANKDNVLGKIRQVRGSCVKETTSGSLQLIDTCFQPSAKDLRLIIGTGDVPNLLVDGLPVKRFIRFAVLGDAERREFQLKVAEEDSCQRGKLVFVYPVAKNQWKDQLRSDYARQEMKVSRGISATYFEHCGYRLEGDFSQVLMETIGLPGSDNYVPVPLAVEF